MLLLPATKSLKVVRKSTNNAKGATISSRANDHRFHACSINCLGVPSVFLPETVKGIDALVPISARTR